MAKYRHTTLLLAEVERVELETIARDLGYLQSRGAGAGKLGSISALIRAIASGDVNVVREKSQGRPCDSSVLKPRAGK